MHRKVAIFLFAIIVIANSPTSCIASRSLVLDGDDATPTSNTFYASEYAPTDDDDSQVSLSTLIIIHSFSLINIYIHIYIHWFLFPPIKINVLIYSCVFIFLFNSS